ncbi:S49 family peptidase [Rhodovastum atsumiense]|uniref:S49 family peptidase n=1 Tax=Rhodovastum atsumiense TaxID=504468 RepID=A0A5M6IXQ9_9PROT|nr:S49 family peptidase [Rhodovastum atsumiense]
MIRLHGAIAARVGTLNIAACGRLVDAAFRAAGAGGTVVLDIDSPGGSPVQSDLIAARIRRRAGETQARVVAVIEETAASGGYWLACAADEIVANPMSVVGSIGVRGGGFGFDQAIARLGVQRRLYTAGQNKARLDPFSPERAEDVAFVNELIGELHERFKAWVRTRRGGRLKAGDEVLFDGSFWLGERGVALGLVDRLGDLDSVVKEVGGEKARAQVFRPRQRGMLGRLPRLVAEALLDAAEARATPRF